MCLCLGPLRAGKTLLLRKLRGDDIDFATSTVKTDGLNIFEIRTTDNKFELSIKELGGSMAPIWTRYLDKVNKLNRTTSLKNILFYNERIIKHVFFFFFSRSK